MAVVSTFSLSDVLPCCSRSSCPSSDSAGLGRCKVILGRFRGGNMVSSIISMVSSAFLDGFISLGDVLEGEELEESDERTFSISLSRPRFCPRPGGRDCRSSLPRLEPRSEPAFLFFMDLADFAAVRGFISSISRLRLVASCLFSSVSLRKRSCGTQSSQLVGFRGELSVDVLLQQ